ncbi:MAG: hypothetical protein ACYC44_00685 [Patescibacteria group bacterium]
MKAEIKFTVFVDSRLTECIAHDAGLLQAFLEAMHNLDLLQQYCVVYRAGQFVTKDRRAMNKVLRGYVAGFYTAGILEEENRSFNTIDALMFAIKEASRVRCMVSERLRTVEVDIAFLSHGEKVSVFSLNLSWLMKNGKVKGGFNGCVFPNGCVYPQFYASKAQPASY